MWKGKIMVRSAINTGSREYSPFLLILHTCMCSFAALTTTNVDRMRFRVACSGLAGCISLLRGQCTDSNYIGDFLYQSLILSSNNSLYGISICTQYWL